MIVGRTITSPSQRRHRSAASLCRHCTVEIPAPGARRRGLVQPTLLTELALPKGRRLGPGVALPACARGRLGVVHWCAFSCHVDTAPPTHSSVGRTMAYRQISFGVVSTQIPCRCPPRFVLPLSEHGRVLAANLSHPIAPSAHPIKGTPPPQIPFGRVPPLPPSSTPVSRLRCAPPLFLPRYRC
jgi:hypothetical protein